MRVLPLKVIEISEENDDLVEKDDAVRHMCDEAHLQSHETWLVERLKTSVRNGRDLSKKAKEWYPHLLFCKDAEAQLKGLAGGTPQFRRVIARLFEIENYCQQWHEGGFEANAIPNASNESDSTMNQYGHLREFVCPDGVKRSFGFHLKGLPGHWRIHIWPDVEGIFCDSSDSPRKILIGYIGNHLPISTG